MLVKQCLEKGLRSPDFESGNGFNVIFWRNVEIEGGMTGGMTIIGIQLEIVNLIRENPKISYKKMSDILKINISAIQKHINKLKNAGIIRRDGADFGGKWIIN